MSDETTAPEESEFDRAMRVLRAPFPESQVGLLPRGVRKNDDERFGCKAGPNLRKASADGKICGGYHALSVHLSYVGHAALTQRLLDADPRWDWEPLALDQRGLPLIADGGLWIRLTVAGVSRLGYGDAPGKRDATKELIGDALRNAAMRFGAALDLWSKEDLRSDEIERGEHDPQGAASGAGNAPAGSPSARGGNGAQASAPPSVDEEARAQWRVRILSIEYLGNKPKEAGPDGGLRTAYLDATKAGILNWAVTPDADETFLQLLQRLSRELPERADESKDTIPPDETPDQRTEREIAERERAEIRRHEAEQGLGRATDDGAPAVLDPNGWGSSPSTGWGEQDEHNGGANGAHTR